MLHKETLYALDDVTIIPSEVSKIRHRSKECKLEYVPIFTAPMDAVVDDKNYTLFEEIGITPIIPRTVDINKRLELAQNSVWIAVGLDEFEEYFLGKINIYKKGIIYNILIDIANGHMAVLPKYIRESKKMADKCGAVLILMVGNVANPETYDILAEAGIDFVRISVGSGACCITSSNTGVHMPMASLLDKCASYKVVNERKAKIVADGGISTYARAIKALALGADYVMMGTALAQCFESAGDFKSVDISERDVIDGFDLGLYNQNRFTNYFTEEDKKQFIGKYHPKKIIYGMSTKKAQLKIAKAAGKECKLKTSEGIERTVEVKYTLKQYLENFLDYLRSAMSYTNSYNLHDFSSYTRLYLLSEGAKNAINK